MILSPSYLFIILQLLNKLARQTDHGNGSLYHNS